MSPPLHDERKVRRTAVPAILGAIIGAAAMYAVTSTPGRLVWAAPIVDIDVSGVVSGLNQLESRFRAGQRMFIDIMDGVHSPQYKLTNETKAYTLTVEIPPEVEPEEVSFDIFGETITVSYEHRSKNSFMSSSVSIGGIPRDINADAAYAEKADEEGSVTVVLPKTSFQPKKTFRATKKESAKAKELKARLVPLN